MADRIFPSKRKTANRTNPASRQKKQPGALFAVKKYLQELRGEFKKIVWPSRQTLVRNTIVTLVMCLFVALFVGLFDLGISAMVKLMLSF